MIFMNAEHRHRRYSAAACRPDATADNRRMSALPAPSPALAADDADLPSPSRPAPRRASLRMQIHLIVAALMGVFVVTVIVMQIDATRRSVREEIVAANRVAAQLLQRVGWVYTRWGRTRW